MSSKSAGTGKAAAPVDLNEIDTSGEVPVYYTHTINL